MKELHCLYKIISQLTQFFAIEKHEKTRTITARRQHGDAPRRHPQWG